MKRGIHYLFLILSITYLAIFILANTVFLKSLYFSSKIKEFSETNSYY